MRTGCTGRPTHTFDVETHLKGEGLRGLQPLANLSTLCLRATPSRCCVLWYAPLTYSIVV